MQFAVGVFNGELVVVGELLSAVNLAQREDDDVLLALHVDDSRVAVGVAGMVDESRGVAVHGGVHHVEIVNAKHVAADALWGKAGGQENTNRKQDQKNSDYSCEYLAVVVFLSFVRENRADDITRILDHHLSGLDVPLAEKATAVNR